MNKYVYLGCVLRDTSPIIGLHLIILAQWWEKYLSKRSPIKHTCSWHDKLIILLQYHDLNFKYDVNKKTIWTWNYNNLNLSHFETENNENWSCLFLAYRGVFKTQSSIRVAAYKNNGFQSLIIFQKSSTTNVSQSSEQASCIYSIDFLWFRSVNCIK